ncbi:MAG TPA: hypothetical protein VFG63_14635 [Nocardioidaceae bacterium]|nr:hypothetical protein [Nocardioidaceae bacterium]
MAWLDEAGEEEVLVRRSRAVGLPGALPDVYGLALRVPVLGDHHGDLLFATTGLGPLGRFVLHPTWSPAGQPMTTLLPYAGPEGAVMLAAVPRAEDRFDLACASLRTPWRMFAELTLLAEDGPDPLLSFDPVRNTVPGLDNYGWVRRLREPAYVVARRTRRED